MSRINYSAEVTNKEGEKIGISGADSVDEAFKALEKAVRDRDLVWEEREKEEVKVPEQKPEDIEIEGNEHEPSEVPGVSIGVDHAISEADGQGGDGPATLG